MTRTLAALTVAALLCPSLRAAPPNVVMIVGDDQGWGDYGFTGHEHVRTPHLDRLAAEGLVFRNGYVPSSLCRPSLASMVTGLFAHQHRITSNDPPLPKGLTGAAAARDPGFLKLRAEMAAYIEKSPTLPRLLAEAGYVSHQSGKWWEGDACRCGGFTEGMTHGDPARGGRHGDEGLTIGREGLKPVFDFLDRAKERGKPFYLWYAPMMPHSPHNPPPRLLSKYTAKTPSIHLARYWAMCEWFDETVGELLGRVAKNGFAENTLVIYLHDNGWIQDLNSPNFAPRSKRSQYNGGLRTPIVVKLPGRVKPGESRALASSVDLAPTVLRAAGLKPTPAMPGLDLLDAAALARRDAVFGDIFTHNAVDVHKPAANLEYRWMIEGDWKLIVPSLANVPKGRTELYNLKADPGEAKNLAETERDRVQKLKARLDAWWKPE